MRKVSSRLVSRGAVVATVPAVGADVAAKIVAAIRVLESRKTGKYAGTHGVHVVFSGLNAEIYRKGYATPDTISGFWQALADSGVIQQRYAARGRGKVGGVIVYVAGEMPVSERSSDAAGLLD